MGFHPPFDLSRLEIWFQGQFLEMAAPEKLVTPHHPDVSLDPTPAAPGPDTSLDYLALLRNERQRLIEEQLGGLNFSQLNPNQTDPQDPPENDNDQ